MKPFGIITNSNDQQAYFPGAESMYGDWAEASIGALTQDKKDKLYTLLQGDEDEHDTVTEKTVVNNASNVSEEEWGSIWTKVPQDLKGYIE